MRRILPALVLVVAAVCPARAQVDTLQADSLRAVAPAATNAPASPGAIDVVRALEARRQAAMVAADTRALADIIAEDATYVHANGLMQTRAELFSMLERGKMRYVKFELEDVRYRAYDGAVIGTGVQRIDVRSAGKDLVLRSRYTAVYVRAGGGWQLVAYESTPTPKITTK